MLDRPAAPDVAAAMHAQGALTRIAERCLWSSLFDLGLDVSGDSRAPPSTPIRKPRSSLF